MSFDHQISNLSLALIPNSSEDNPFMDHDRSHILKSLHREISTRTENTQVLYNN